MSVPVFDYTLETLVRDLLSIFNDIDVRIDEDGKQIITVDSIDSYRLRTILKMMESNLNGL